MIQQNACNIFSYNLLRGAEDFSAVSPYVYKIALYNANANLGPDTQAYTADNEVTGAGYDPGGQELQQIAPAYYNGSSYISFDPVQWTNSSFTTRGALIYNSTTGAAVCVLNFGSDKTTNNQTFTISFPLANATDAIIRIATPQ